MNERQLDKWITTLQRLMSEMDDVTNDLNDIHVGSGLSRIAYHLKGFVKDLDDMRADIPMQEAR